MRTEFLRLAKLFVIPLFTSLILASMCFLFYILSTTNLPFIGVLINSIPVMG